MLLPSSVRPIGRGEDQCRCAIDVAAGLAPELSAGQLCHWEATLDLFHEKDLAIRTICMYDRALSTAEIHGALRTHPVVLAQGKLCLNPDYEAPAILANEPHLNVSTADAETVDHMIERLVAEA